MFFKSNQSCFYDNFTMNFNFRVKRKFWLRTGKASIFNKFENEKRKALVSRNLTLLQQYHEALRRYEDGNYLREPKFDIDDEIQMNDAVKKIQGYIFILRRLQKTPKNTQKRWKGKVVPWKDQWRAELRKRKIFEVRFIGCVVIVEKDLKVYF